MPAFFYKMIDSLKIFAESLNDFDTADEVLNIIHANRQKIAELQKDQLSEGIDVTGKKRVDEYRPFTIAEKKRRGIGLGAVTDRVTFFMSGEMYDNLETDIDGDKFLVTVQGSGGSSSSGPAYKYDKMIDRIGEDNYGLSEESRMKFANDVTMLEFAVVLKEKTGIILNT